MYKRQGWYDVAIGRSGFVISNIASTYEPKIAVRLYLSARQGGVLALQRLAAEKDTIEREVGMPLKWDANPEAMDKTIAAVRTADISKREEWPDHLCWMKDITLRFRNAFGPRIRAMDLGDHPTAEPNGVDGVRAVNVQAPP